MFEFIIKKIKSHKQETHQLVKLPARQQAKSSQASHLQEKPVTPRSFLVLTHHGARKVSPTFYCLIYMKCRPHHRFRPPGMSRKHSQLEKFFGASRHTRIILVEAARHTGDGRNFFMPRLSRIRWQSRDTILSLSFQQYRSAVNVPSG